jgi:hypothetical protein
MNEEATETSSNPKIVVIKEFDEVTATIPKNAKLNSIDKASKLFEYLYEIVDMKRSANENSAKNSSEKLYTWKIEKTTTFAFPANKIKDTEANAI